MYIHNTGIITQQVKKRNRNATVSQEATPSQPACFYTTAEIELVLPVVWQAIQTETHIFLHGMQIFGTDSSASTGYELNRFDCESIDTRTLILTDVNALSSSAKCVR